MRSLGWIAGGIGALVVLAVAAVLLAGNRPAETFPADTPQGVFQRFLAAVEDGDAEAAYGFLSERVRGRVSLEEYERQLHDADGMFGAPTRRVLFDRVTGSDERKTLHLTVEELYGEGFDASRSRYPVQVRMTLDGDEWRIDEPLVGVHPGHFPALP